MIRGPKSICRHKLDFTVTITLKCTVQLKILYYSIEFGFIMRLPLSKFLKQQHVISILCIIYLLK